MAIQFPSPVADGYSFTAENGVVYTFDSSGGGGWYAYHPDGLNDVYVNIDGDTMTGDLTVPSLNGGPLAGLRNAIINGDFRVWQRGDDQTFTGATPENYGADRWFVRAPNNVGASSIEFKKVDDGSVSKARIVFNGSPSSKCFCSQRIEAANIKGHYGREMTLSFNLENVSMGTAPTPTVTVISYNSANAGKTIVAEATPIPNVDGTKYSVTFTYDTTDGTVNSDNERGLLVSININGSSAVSAGACQLWNVQLEPGPVATEFESRPYGLELSLCQRYYQTLDRIDMYMASENSGTNSRSSNWTFATAMRAAPSVTFTKSGGASLDVFSTSMSSTRFSGTTGGTTGTITALDLAADAEL